LESNDKLLQWFYIAFATIQQHNAMQFYKAGLGRMRVDKSDPCPSLLQRTSYLLLSLAAVVEIKFLHSQTAGAGKGWLRKMRESNSVPSFSAFFLRGAHLRRACACLTAIKSKKNGKEAHWTDVFI